MKKCFVFLVLLAVCAAGCSPALKDLKPALIAMDSGNIWYASTESLAFTPEMSRYEIKGPDVISGDLRFPSGTGPFPTVIIAHGCSGITNAEIGWETVLREWGYATFVIDSFRGRNLNEVCANANALTATQRIPDAYGALRILATHPKIDAQRVVLMGFSHGGSLTMGASTTWAKETFAASSTHAFRAFLAFYPYCNIAYPERERISAPVRIHTGELDDWCPAAPCARLAESLKATGQDASITVYPGAHHSFVNSERALYYLPNVTNSAACAIEYPSILGPFTSELSKWQKCLRKGATVAGNPKATEDARRNVRDQLAELLK
jgi:dienelactone hydrolase